MEQGRITEADTPTVQLGANPSELASDPPPSSPHFYARCPFILAWDRHRNMLDCIPPMAWFTSMARLPAWLGLPHGTTAHENQSALYMYTKSIAYFP